MTLRPRASLGRVLDDLGATLLELAHGDTDDASDIGGVVIHDPLDEQDLPRRALVLGIGLREREEVVAVLAKLGEQHAAGLVLRAPVSMNEAVAEAADRAGIAILGLTRGASWAQLAAMLRSSIAEGSVGAAASESLGGIPSGDLFALANAITALLDAPVTIEDTSSRVLAFSARQDEADTSRVETILGRQVPERFTQRLVEQGVFRVLYSSDAPLWIPEEQPGNEPRQLPRVAVTVRAGDEVLGSIWAAVREPLNDERTRAFSDAAKLVALHMLHVRAGADVKRRLRTDLLSTALEGGIGAREALNRLGLFDQSVVVLALTLLDRNGDVQSIRSDADHVTELQRISDAFAMHLGAVHPRSAAALVGDVAYGLVPVRRDGTDGEERAMRVAADFLARISDRGLAVMGVGPVAHDTAELAYARTSADRVLRVLRVARDVDRRVAGLADVHVEALMLELRDIVTARGDRILGPLARIVDYDTTHHSNLVQTLQAWLNSFGDVIAASAELYVHPNTFRYRLKRLAEIGRLDLSDPEVRFAASLQLRLIDHPMSVKRVDTVSGL
ncbi:MAG: putative transcriptional regulator, PucR family [Pseudonocardiales bacterium]|nr:putative transcriptional regulator, PucR family [Pseudonocardiales bacterium]